MTGGTSGIGYHTAFGLAKRLVSHWLPSFSPEVSGVPPPPHEKKRQVKGTPDFSLFSLLLHKNYFSGWKKNERKYSPLRLTFFTSSLLIKTLFIILLQFVKM